MENEKQILDYEEMKENRKAEMEFIHFLRQCKKRRFTPDKLRYEGFASNYGKGKKIVSIRKRR